MENTKIESLKTEELIELYKKIKEHISFLDSSKVKEDEEDE